MPTLTEEVAALADMSTDEIAVLYESTFLKAPRVRHRRHMLKRLAFAIQNRKQPVLSPESRRILDSLIAELDLDLSGPTTTAAGKQRGTTKPAAPPIGLVYSRIWHGAEVRVTVVDGGFEHTGIVHRSLSAAVRAITSQKWNPSIFFNLKPRGKKS